MGDLKFLSGNFKSLRSTAAEMNLSRYKTANKNYRSNSSASTEHKSHDRNLTEEDL